MKELKEIESYNGQAALLLSSSTDKIAQDPEQAKEKERESKNPDQGKGNRTRYLMKRASPGITPPPRTGDGSWTHYQPKRASPETSPPLAESRNKSNMLPFKKSYAETQTIPSTG